MKPSTERPEACAIDGQIHVFVGGSWQVMTPVAAERLATKITQALDGNKMPTTAEPTSCCTVAAPCTTKSAPNVSIAYKSGKVVPLLGKF